MAESFYLPTTLVQGNGCFQQLGMVAAKYGKRALLVCGKRSMRASGVLDRAQVLLAAAGVGSALLDRVRGEPTVGLVEEGLQALKENGCDLVIGLGGGSAMDVAKAVAGLATLPGSAAEYLAGREPDVPGLPFIAVPTTAGTGAEVTKNAVLIDPEAGIKTSIRSDDWFARVALVDPELTVSAPPAVTAAAGADALCQALESYVSLGAMPLTDALCEAAIERIGRSLARACERGHDLEARADMLYGSLLAGMALANARLGAVHGLAHPLGYRYHIPHGVICGLLLPHVMAYNLPYAGHKYARAARLMGLASREVTTEDAGQALVKGVAALLRGIGLPLRLSELDVQIEDWPLIIEQSLPSGSMKHNPRPMGEDDVRAVLEVAT